MRTKEELLSEMARCVRDMVRIGQEYGARWFTAGARSKAGHPHHPLYLKKDSVLDPFDDLDAYLEGLSSSGGAGHRT